MFVRPNKQVAWRLTSRQTTPPFCELSNDKFIVSKTVERAQLIFLLSFNIAISDERVSLFAVLCEGGAPQLNGLV